MDPLWRTALWQQFGATIDMLENALLACPNTHWNGRLWSDHSDHSLSPESAAFWYLTYHTLFWLDLYLAGSHEGFAPPHPSPWMNLTQQVSFPNGPIPGMSSTPIWCICARSARQRLLGYQTRKRNNWSLSPGPS